MIEHLEHLDNLNEAMAVLTAFANEEPVANTWYGCLCLYCSGNDRRSGAVQHKDDCPWIRARRIVGMSEAT